MRISPGWWWRSCRRRRIVVPSPGALERLCVQARYQARGEVQSRLIDGLSAEQRLRLDALTQRRAETNQSWLAWLHQMPEAAKPVAMLGLIERLDHVRADGLDPAHGHRVHQARFAQLAREAGRTTVQYVAGYERQRRHAILVAVTLDLAASLTDQAVDLFDRLIGMMFRKANERHARAFQADGRAINEKVRLYARVGAALIAARGNQQDAFDAITAVIPWDRFLATVAEAGALARSEEFEPYQMLGEHYAGIRRWAPAFLDAFVSRYFTGPCQKGLARRPRARRDRGGRTRRHDAGLLRRHLAVERLGADQALFRDIDFKVGEPPASGASRARREHTAYRERVLEALAASDFEIIGEPYAGNASRFFSADVAYGAQFGAGRGLRPHIRIEMSFRAPALAPVERPIRSLIAAAQREPHEIASFPCVDPVETAADKLSALAWRVRARDRSRADDDPTIVRHLHDLAVA